MSMKRIVAITACPTGVAHTFMAAEAIEGEAKKRGHWVKVETRGSVGAKNALTAEEIAAADLVIIAADIEVDLSRFNGKKLYKTSTGAALKKIVTRSGLSETDFLRACGFHEAGSTRLRQMINGQRPVSSEIEAAARTLAAKSPTG